MTDLQQPAAPPIDLDAYELYFNRELSWLQFNDRVLQLAEDESLPLLERVKFCAIYSNNLDEFFMVRVAGLQEYVDAGIEKPREDGRSPAETIAAIGAAVREQTQRQTTLLARLEVKRRDEADAVQRRQNALASMRDGLAARQRTQIRARAARAAALAGTRDGRRAATASSAGPGGPWAIPWPIVQCESGGQNLSPNRAGASGYYQFLPTTWRNLGGSTPAAYQASKAEQDRLAARLWAAGAGAHNWDCAGLVG